MARMSRRERVELGLEFGPADRARTERQAHADPRLAPYYYQTDVRAHPRRGTRGVRTYTRLQAPALGQGRVEHDDHRFMPLRGTLTIYEGDLDLAQSHARDGERVLATQGLMGEVGVVRDPGSSRFKVVLHVHPKGE
jgi:hypothetical protein